MWRLPLREPPWPRGDLRVGREIAPSVIRIAPNTGATSPCRRRSGRRSCAPVARPEPPAHLSPLGSPERRVVRQIHRAAWERVLGEARCRRVSGSRARDHRCLEGRAASGHGDLEPDTVTPMLRRAPAAVSSLSDQPLCDVAAPPGLTAVDPGAGVPLTTNACPRVQSFESIACVVLVSFTHSPISQVPAPGAPTPLAA
jgi:hypothetical protein